MNIIHPTAIIHESVQFGDNNKIGAYCIIGENVEIGNNNIFTAYCSIGLPPEHKALDLHNHIPKHKTIIGNNNVIREFVTIHNGFEGDTKIGSNCYIMTKSHVGHDTTIGDNVTISSVAIIGGHCKIDDYANLGLGSITHQFSYIGTGAMLGMGAIVPKNKLIRPFKIYVGNPCRFLKDNTYLIKKLEISDGRLATLDFDYENKIRGVS